MRKRGTNRVITLTRRSTLAYAFGLPRERFAVENTTTLKLRTWGCRLSEPPNNCNRRTTRLEKVSLTWRFEIAGVPGSESKATMRQSTTTNQTAGATTADESRSQSAAILPPACPRAQSLPLAQQNSAASKPVANSAAPTEAQHQTNKSHHSAEPHWLAHPSPVTPSRTIQSPTIQSPTNAPDQPLGDRPFAALTKAAIHRPTTD